MENVSKLLKKKVKKKRINCSAGPQWTVKLSEKNRCVWLNLDINTIPMGKTDVGTIFQKSSLRLNAFFIV